MGSRFLVAASKYAAARNAYRFLRVKRFLRRFHVKSFATGSRYVETTVPGEGCYIVHMIAVGYRDEPSTKLIEFSLRSLVDAFLTVLTPERTRFMYREWVKRVKWLKRFDDIVLECLLKLKEKYNVKRLSEEHHVRDLVDRYYDEMYDCVAERIERVEGCRRVIASVIRRFECVVATSRRKKVVRHAVRLVRARQKTVKGHRYYVVKARVPARIAEAGGKIYVHVFRGVCVEAERPRGR